MTNIHKTAQVCAIAMILLLFTASCGRAATLPVLPGRDRTSYTYSGKSQMKSERTGPDGLPLAAESGDMKLYFDAVTTRFLLDDGLAIWESFPNEETVDADETTYGEYKRAMQSLLTVRITDSSGAVVKEYASFQESVQEETFAVQYIADDQGNQVGVHVNFTFENLELDIAVEILLEDGGLRLSVPADGMRLHSADHYILDVTLCPFFGSADKEADGYILVPDGSGGIINFNNNCTTYGLYEAQVYGADAAFLKETAPARSEPARLPVFGLKNGSHAFLGIVESGDAFANIIAGVSGIVSDRNFVHTRFRLKEMGTYQLRNIEGEYADFPVVDKFKKEYPELSVSYRFLHGDDANYTGMATVCSRRLGLLNNPVGGYSEARLMLELYGAVKKDKTVAGIPTTVTEKMTTFSQAEDMVSDLEAAGLSGIMIRYQYATENTVEMQPSDSIKLMSVLGGRKGYDTLNLRMGGENLFLSVNNTHTYGSFLQTGGRHAQSLSGLPAYQYLYNIMSGYKRSWHYYILSPPDVAELYADLISRSQNWSIGSLCLSDLGNLVYSDFANPVMTRAQTQELWMRTLKKGADSGLRLMLEGGNAYALPYASAVADVPVKSNRYAMIDYDVPFYQLAVSGSLLCVSESVNLSSNPRLQLLKCIETGTLPQYSFISESFRTLHRTELEGLFGGNYSKWKDELTESMLEYKTACDALGGPGIKDHRFIQDGVAQVTGHSGAQLLINFNETDVIVGDMAVESLSYIIIH